MIADLIVTRDGLGHLQTGIRVPVMLPAVTREDAAELGELADKVPAFHQESTSSSTFLA